MDDSPDDLLHPNWVALATVRLKPKIFVKSSGTEDEIYKREISTKQNIVIDESSSIVYNEVLRMPSTARTSMKNTSAKRKRVRIEKIEFKKQELFKLAMANDSDGIHQLWLRSISPDVNATDGFGWSALMIAACGGSGESFYKLLQLGADVSIEDKKGNTAISLAQNKGHREIIELFEAFNDPNQSIEISDDEDELPEDGKLFCRDCGIEVSQSSSTSHQTSTVHLFSCKFKGNANIKSFGIARTNLGYKMMRRTGWDGRSALGPRGNGKLYPIKTIMRKNRSGLGIEQNSAKITHFKPNDPSSIKFKPLPRAPTRKEIHENDLRDKRHEQRLRRALS